MAPVRGKRLGRYEIVRRLGAGGMGVVYQAYDPQLRRMIAIKFLADSTGGSAESASPHLLREARLASRLNHSNICTVHEVGQADGDAYIAMEYVDGRTLRETIPAAGLPVETVLRMGIQIADALAHAHDHRLVHRDLKSSNVMVTADGKVKVLDFGLAITAGGGSSDATRSETAVTSVFGGTLDYMAPEALRLETVDARSDIWSLGIILHEMASGAMPFSGKSPADRVSAILREPPRPLPPDIPASLRGTIQRCLSKDPAQRYQRASEVRAALEAALIDLGGRGVEAPPPARRPLWLASAGLIALAVVVAAVVLTFRGAHTDPSPPTTSARIDSLAVLPLENLSREPDEEFFSDGMTDALITRLSRISAWRVISRASVMRYKAVHKPLAAIARELNVQAIVQGTVLRSNGRVRIGVQLTDPSTERILWANSYERDLGDSLALQGQVARAIAEELRITLTPDERTQLAASRRVDPAAHDAFLRGRAQVDSRTRKAFERAIGQFQRAIDIDPQFAQAYAGLADAYALVGYLGFAAPAEAFSRSKAAARKALALEDDLAEAHAALAMGLFFDRDWTTAEPEFQRALALNPSSSTAHHWYSHYLTAMNRMPASIAASQRALELEPLNANIAAHLAWAYYYARRMADAIAQCDKTLALDPEYFQGYQFRGMALIQRGNLVEAIRDLEHALSLPEVPRANSLGRLGYAYAAAGNTAKAREIARELAALSAESLNAPEAESQVYLGLGERNRALDALERAYALHSASLLNINVEPLYDPLKSELRFQDLVHRMGLGRSPG